MAHIRKLDGGRWQARYRDAERKERAHNFRTKAEAQRWLDEQTADLVRGDWRDPRSGQVTIGDLAETWYGTRAALKASTRLSYRSLLDAWVLPRWSPIHVRRIEHGAVAAWVAEVGAETSASTTRKVAGVLRSILELAVRDRRIPANPATGVSLPRLPMAEQRFLNAGELEGLADAMPTPRDHVITLLLGWTGLRFGEAAALRVESIDLASTNPDHRSRRGGPRSDRHGNTEDARGAIGGDPRLPRPRPRRVPRHRVPLRPRVPRCGRWPDPGDQLEPAHVHSDGRECRPRSAEAPGTRSPAYGSLAHDRVWGRREGRSATTRPPHSHADP